MRKSIKLTTIQERLFNIKIIHAKKATNTLLKKFKIIYSPLCEQCEEEDETNEHHTCHCTANTDTRDTMRNSISAA